MQIKLGTFGQIVEGLDDLNQEILLILATPLGSVPHQPELGSRIYEYLDRPMNIAKPLIVAEAYRALKKNCTRFKVRSIKLVSASSSGKFVFKITGVPTDSQIDKEVVLSVFADFTR